MTATRTGPSNPRRGGSRPASSQRNETAGPVDPALELLRRQVEPDGLVIIPVRSVAAELELTTIAARALIRRLLAEGLLVEIGRGTYALPGSPVADHGGEDAPVPPRVPPHAAVHDGTGSPLLW